MSVRSFGRGWPICNAGSDPAEHVSNWDFADANEGLDAIGVRYGYKF